MVAISFWNAIEYMPMFENLYDKYARFSSDYTFF